jgi:hypothetical protein
MIIPRELVALYAFILLLLSSLPLYAQSGYSEFERDLRLSESQKQQVSETKRKYMEELQVLKQESINKRLELRQLDRSPGVDPEKRERLQRELGAIENTRFNLYNQYRSEVSRALNQAQRDKYNSFVDTEARRGVNRPVPSSPQDHALSPPMTRLPPPPLDRSVVNPPLNRANPPLSTPSYRPMGPPAARPVAPPLNRPPAPSPPRGYGR